MDLSFTAIVVAILAYLTCGALGALFVSLFAVRNIARLRSENNRLKARLRLALGAPEHLERPRFDGVRPEAWAYRAAPILALLVLVSVGLREARAETDARPAPQAQGEAAPAAAAAAPRDANAVQYCRNIADAAADARFTRQKEALAAMEKDIEARIAQLEAKRAEYQDWLQRRETFLKKADDALVAVISQMRPDAAAAQMAAMDEAMAAALLSKLSPRVASAIMNEIDPQRAARLTSTMVGLGRRSADGKSG